MLPVCSATTTCSSHSQIMIQGGLQNFSSYRKAFEVQCIAGEISFISSCGTKYLHACSLKPETAPTFPPNFLDGRETSLGFNVSKYEFSNNWNYYIADSDVSSKEQQVGGLEDQITKNANILADSDISFGEQQLSGLKDQLTKNANILADSDVSPGVQQLSGFEDQIAKNANILADSDISYGEQLSGLEDQINGNANILADSTNPQTVILPKAPVSASDVLTIDSDSLSNVKNKFGDVYSGVNESLSSSVNKGESFLNRITEEFNSFFTSANKSVDNTVTQLSSSIDQIKESANGKLTGLSSEFNEVSSSVGASSVDLLRGVIIQIEGSINQGATYGVYAYESAKELLPLEVKNAVNLSEGTAVKILRPLGTVFEQIYVAISELEKILGVNPNDPIVHLILFVGTSATLWVSYLSITYGGYAGDLSPKLTMELLNGKENVVLVDVRPEVLREKDGIPDLRRVARLRYTNVILPEIDSSVKKLLKSGKDFDDALIAAIIRNLKIIQDRSKVVVVDADGTRSKGIARSLRKLGVKQPYLVKGGFRSWVKEGLRVKELKPETALTILNEEAEAILEEIKPTPLGVVSYGVGFVAALFALSEWEKTLQLIGIVGLFQSIYRRLASYEGADDFKQDVSLLLTPVRAGGQALSWAAGKLETNGTGLPTSPSSSDVQNRVLQAAAKHESQPSDDENQESLSDLMAPANDGADLS